VTVVLDSWAALAVVKQEPSATRVLELLGDQQALMSWINLGEVAYLEERRLGRVRAGEIVDALASSTRAELPDIALVRAAAQWKAQGGLSYADAFAAATAARHDADLLTGDDELLFLHGQDGLRVIDVRRA
jgi:PIN domain nuclease of toxin-antitoxin system